MLSGLEKRLARLEQEMERRELASRPRVFTQLDEDAIAIYSSMSYLDATVCPSYDQVEPTPIYARGSDLRDALYGPIIPVHQDEHIKRHTRASGEFELAFGREPKAGDILRYRHLQLTHSFENYSRVFGRIIEAWQRQLPQLICPLRYEKERLFRRLTPERHGVESKWQEDTTIDPLKRWFEIPGIAANSELKANLILPAIVFKGVVGDKHQCKGPTEEDLQRPETEPVKVPTIFAFGEQRFNLLLFEVFGT
jgi:hypothetical protein